MRAWNKWRSKGWLGWTPSCPIQLLAQEEDLRLRTAPKDRLSEHVKMEQDRTEDVPQQKSGSMLELSKLQ